MNEDEYIGGIRLEPHVYKTTPDKCSHNWEHLMEYTEYAPDLEPHSIVWCSDCGATDIIFKDEQRYPKDQTT